MQNINIVRASCMAGRSNVTSSFHQWQQILLLRASPQIEQSAGFLHAPNRPLVTLDRSDHADNYDLKSASFTSNMLHCRKYTSALNAHLRHERPLLELPGVSDENNSGNICRTFPATSHYCQRNDRQKGSSLNRDSFSKLQLRQLTLSPKAIVDASPLSLQPYLKLIRFDRPIGTWLLFLPCAWSISLAAPAGYFPDPWMLTLFALGSFSMRAAACTINDMWDKDYDARVERTKDRPLACGQISQFRALVFLALPLSASLGILLTFNWNTVALGACSMFPCIIYPLMKRITYWPQAFLGITLNWGVMIAWSAIHGSMDLTGLTLYTSCVLWTMIYDTIYSHQDKADDIQVGVKSTALKFGNHTKFWLSGFATGVTSSLVAAGAMCDQPWLYYAGVGVVAAHLANQIYSVDLNNMDSCARTFRSNRNLGLIFWGFLVASGLLAGVKHDKSSSGDGSEAVDGIEAVEGDGKNPWRTSSGDLEETAVAR